MFHKKTILNFNDELKIKNLSDLLLETAKVLGKYEGQNKTVADLNEGYLFLHELMGEKVNSVRQSLYSAINGKHYGEIGEYTGYKDYHVGDIIKVRDYKYEVIAKSDGQYYVYGWKGLSLREMEMRNNNLFERILRFNEYTDRDLRKYSRLMIKNLVN